MVAVTRAHVGLATLVIALSASAVAAQTPTARPASSVERTLLRLEDQWTCALVRRDSAAFDRLLAPRFVYTENDQVMTKAQLIDAVVHGSDTVESAANEDMKAYVYPNASVVTGWLVVKGRGKDGAFNRRYRYTDTWIYRSGRWQVIAAHDYLAP
jgi:ketosteroid isomerase-like protein